MVCCVFTLKLDKSNLNLKQKEFLNKIFLEAKWFYNYCLSHKDISEAVPKIKSVPVMLKDKSFEDRELTVLNCSSKQSIKTGIFSSLKTLSALKKKGKKVGRLGFKPRCESIPFPATGLHGCYQLMRQENRINVAKSPRPFKVNGLDQIPTNAELANANLLCKHGEYYFQVTCYLPKDEQYVQKQHQINQQRKGKAVGLDFGCTTQLTGMDNDGNGFKIEFEVPIDKRLRRLHRKVSRKLDRTKAKADRVESKNRLKSRLLAQRQHAHLTNVKKDIRNKVVSALTKHYEVVCVQDENIKGWQKGGHGKKIQNTGIGGMMRDLRNKSRTLREVEQFVPTTKACSQCGCLKLKMEQWERTYECEDCGAKMDRDGNSALSILTLGTKDMKEIQIKLEIAREPSELTLGKMGTSVGGLMERLRSIPRVVCKPLSLNQEAHGL
jgi:transposase